VQLAVTPYGGMAPPSPKTSAFTRFGRGMTYLFKGAGFVGKHPRLLPLCVGPVLTSIILVLLLIIGANWGVSYLSQRWGGGHGVWAGVIYILLMIFVVAALVFLGAVVLLSLAASPFCSLISERTEALATGKPVPSQSWGQIFTESLRGIGHALIRVFCYLALTLPLSALGFFLSPIAPVFLILQFVISAFFLAYDFLDYPLSRRCVGFGAKWIYVDRHRADSFGFGVTVALAILVPLANVIVPPIAAVGATLLYVDLGDRA
jgi:CysZ protein